MVTGSLAKNVEVILLSKVLEADIDLTPALIARVDGAYAVLNRSCDGRG